MLGRTLAREGGSASAVRNALSAAAAAKHRMETATATMGRVAELSAKLEVMGSYARPRRSAAKIARDFANEIRAIP